MPSDPFRFQEPDPNPFQQPFDFEERQPFRCPRCDELVPYEERKLSVRERLEYSWYWDPFSFLLDWFWFLPRGTLDVVRETKWVCPTCFEELRRVKRRPVLLRLVVILFEWGFILLLVVLVCWLSLRKR